MALRRWVAWGASSKRPESGGQTEYRLERATGATASTNPRLVRRIVEHCLQAGAKEVYVFRSHCDAWRDSYRASGIEQAVKDAGGKLAPGNSESYFQTVAIPGGRRLRRTQEHELVLGADVFINVPVLKSHGGARLSVAMKNLMGVVWDRGEWHSTTCISASPTSPVIANPI